MTLARPAASAATPRSFRLRIPAHLGNTLGLLAGVGAGLAARLLAGRDAPWLGYLTTEVTGPIGNLFLRLLFLLSLPLLFAAIMSGIGAIGSLASLRRMGLRIATYIVGAAMLAVLLGLAAVNLARPGDGIDPIVARSLLAAAEGNGSIVGPGALPTIGLSGVVRLIPGNALAAAMRGNTMGVALLAILLGIGLLLVRTESTARLRSASEGLFDVGSRLFDIMARAMPFALACLMFNLAISFDWRLLPHLGAYVGVVVAALLLYTSVVLSSAVWILGGMSPIAFFGAVREAALVAFCTSSSQATLPTTLRSAEQWLRLPAAPARIMLAIGASTNQNGTAIYQSVTVVFLAQIMGVQLEPVQQLAVFAVCVLGGIGTAGVPAGSLPVVAMILAMLDIAPAAIGIVIGIDRLLDMCRTVLNVLSDLAIAVVISRES